MNELTTSGIARQNVLNNRYAVEKIREHLQLQPLFFEGEYYLTKQMVADFYGVETRTIERCLAANEEELTANGYFLCRGNRLKAFRLQFVSDIDVGNKAPRVGLFSFRAFLNVGMLLTDSERAKQVRSLILDLSIAAINERAGGGTRYINRKDINFLPAAIREENYHKSFTNALNQCVDGHKTYKYAQAADFIYKAVFRENAKEYRQLLKLGSKDNVRQTLYAEVLMVIASFENGVAAVIRARWEQNNGMLLTMDEVADIVRELADNPMQAPYLSDARSKMASRDLSFRDIYHGNIAEYLRAVTPEEYERFIGSESIDFDRLLEENKDVLKRLKQADDGK